MGELVESALMNTRTVILLRNKALYRVDDNTIRYTILNTMGKLYILYWMAVVIVEFKEKRVCGQVVCVCVCVCVCVEMWSSVRVKLLYTLKKALTPELTHWYQLKRRITKLVLLVTMEMTRPLLPRTRSPNPIFYYRYSVFRILSHGLLTIQQYKHCHNDKCKYKFILRRINCFVVVVVVGLISSRLAIFFIGIFLNVN